MSGPCLSWEGRSKAGTSSQVLCSRMLHRAEKKGRDLELKESKAFPFVVLGASGLGKLSLSHQVPWEPVGQCRMS